jgi:excisionase family DNA binding protein
MAPTQLLRPDEVAERLNISRASVYRLLDRGALRGVRLGDGPKAHLRVEPEEVDRYIAHARFGNDVAERAEQLVARRGEDPDDGDAYFRALKDLEAEAAVFADRLGQVIGEQVEEAHRRGWVATASRPVGSDVVDVEKIMLEELKRLGSPLPDAISALGPKGLARETLRLLDDQGLESYSEGQYRKALRAAIKAALNPQRAINPTQRTV